MPAGKPETIDQLIIGIPAEDHIAKPQPLVESRQKFFAPDIFAAQHAIAVEESQLDMLDAAIVNERSCRREFLRCVRPLGSFRHK